jgi:hypothetical protein
MDEVYSFALRNALTEIQNICPDIKCSFLFREDGEIVAGDENTTEQTMVNVINSFDGILEKADSIGGIERITLTSRNGSLNLSCVNDMYLVTVASQKADMNYVNTVTRVLIPTVLKLLEKITSAPVKRTSFRSEPEPQLPKFKREEKLIEETAEEDVTEEPVLEQPAVPEIKPEPLLPEPPVSQFIVENLGGLLVPSDTVRIDNEILTQWEELYNGRKIEEIDIETFGGQTIRVKVKPIKDSKYEGKGVTQMPEKIQLALEIKKGELVRVKPVVE